MNKSVIRTILVDDHPIVRAGLRTIQDIEPQIQFVAEASTAAEAIEAARKERPDLILMDARLPDITGIEACRMIKMVLAEVRILFLTSFADNDLVLAAMEAGADGYLLKGSDARRIVAAIHSVLAGGAVFDPVVNARELERLKSGRNLLGSLTQQERRVLAEVATGKTDKEIGTALGLTAKTVRNYLDRVFQKLKVNTRTQAAMLYAQFSSENR